MREEEIAAWPAEIKEKTKKRSLVSTLRRASGYKKDGHVSRKTCIDRGRGERDFRCHIYNM